MRVAQIDFAAAPRSSRIGMVLLAIGVFAAGGAVFDDSRRSEALTQLQDRYARLETAVERVRRNTGAGGIASLTGSLTQSSNAMQRLAAPWGKLLDALEQAQQQSDAIALLVIEPDSGRSRLRIGGEAKDLAALVSYMQSLEASDSISGLRLLNQQIKQEDAQHPVVFQLEAQWGKVPNATLAPPVQKVSG